MAKTIIQKIWEAHSVKDLPDPCTLLFIDRHYFHEGSFHAFSQMRSAGLTVAFPELSIGFADHYAPSRGRTVDAAPSDDIRKPLQLFSRNVVEFGLRGFDLGDTRQGIVHVVGPELGLTLPGMTIVCGDSHTSTHGAVGSLAFGIGASEVKHVLATQTLWQTLPRQMRITLNGTLQDGVTAKDLALTIIARIGTAGATGHLVEFAGPVVQNLPMEGRLTLCNMSIEAGARASIIAPDEVTFAYLAGRPHAPKEAAFEAACAYWRTLRSDDDATFDCELALDCSDFVPMVTWGTNPDTAIRIDGLVPDPADASSADERDSIDGALSYMDIAPGSRIADLAIDRVFIGSCTNGRLDDLRAAAAIARQGKAVIPALVSPGSTAVRRAAEAEGLDQVFRDAGFEWAESSCSMCVGLNGDLLKPGERCASTTNRNFRGRQGPGGRTHLVSPATAAATALAGRIVDPRQV